MKTNLEMQLISQLEPREIQNYIAIQALPKFKAVRKMLASSESVTVIIPTSKDIYRKNIVDNFLKQTVKNKELIIILNNNSRLNLKEWIDYVQKYKNIRVSQFNEPISLGACLNFGVQRSTGNFIARFDDDDYYGPEYLEESLLYFEITGAAVVGKVSHFIYFEENQQFAVCATGMGFKYSDYLNGSTHIIRRGVFEKTQYPDMSLAEDVNFIKACINAGFRVYSADPFNHLRFRRVNKDYHTWKIGDQDFLSMYCKILTVTDDPIGLHTALVNFIKNMSKNGIT